MQVDIRDVWVQSLSCKDPLDKEMAVHSSFLAWKIPWTEEAGGLQSMELHRGWAQLKQLSKHACIRIESTFILACVYPVILAPLFEKCFSLIKLSWHPCWHLLFFPCMQSEAHYTVLHPWGFLFEDIIFPSNYYMLLYQDFP